VDNNDQYNHTDNTTTASLLFNSRIMGQN